MDVQVIIQSSVYNSVAKQNLVVSQNQTSIHEKISILQEWDREQDAMSIEVKRKYIIDEWKRFQKQCNGLDIQEDDYDISETDFKMSIFDFAQYGFLASENVKDDYYDYIPMQVETDGVGHYTITLQNCNKTSVDFNQVISIFANKYGPDPSTLRIKL